MRVCLHTVFCIDEGFIGGTERFLIDLAKELNALGHETFIVCSGTKGDITVEGVPVLQRLPEYLRGKLAAHGAFTSSFLKKEVVGNGGHAARIFRLSKYAQDLLKGVSCDVVHMNSFPTAAYYELKTPAVVTNHENSIECNTLWGEGFFEELAFLIADRRTSLHKMKHLYVPSLFYAQTFHDTLKTKVSNVPLGVNLTNFKMTHNSSSRRSKGNGLNILLPSRFQPKQKGHDIALSAAKHLKEKGIDFTMTFSGVKKSCEHNISEFEMLARELQVQDRVHKQKFLSMQEAYDAADIVISPERYCSYGLSISESLSLGIPTVLSDIPTYKEIAEGFQHAFFFQSDDAVDLADKILQAREFLPRLSEEAVRFRTTYDLRECAKYYSTVYYDVTRKNASLDSRSN